MTRPRQTEPRFGAGLRHLTTETGAKHKDQAGGPPLPQAGGPPLPQAGGPAVKSSIDSTTGSSVAVLDR